jgi:hypothetical protein
MRSIAVVTTLLAALGAAAMAGCGVGDGELPQSTTVQSSERERRAEHRGLIEQAVRRYNLGGRSSQDAVLRGVASTGPYHPWCGLTVTDERSGQVGVQAFHPVTRIWIEAIIDPRAGVIPGSTIKRVGYIPGGYEPDQWFSMLSRQCAIDSSGLITLL